MSLKKQYNETKPVCKVTFKLANDITSNVSQVNLAGDFNNWDIESTPMKKLKGGEFSVSIDLKKDREYQFKYLIDGRIWQNEPDADKQVQNEFKSENSVVIV
ncbi:MAG: isoamylase early set domain-containing protein [Salinivirgaceae bacterium]